MDLLVLKIPQKKQKQPPEVFYQEGVFKNFTKFTGKHLCWSLFFDKLQAWDLQFYLKWDSSTGVFLKLFEIFKNTIFTKHLRATS